MSVKRGDYDVSEMSLRFDCDESESSLSSPL
jgi:hypothetical protein